MKKLIVILFLLFSFFVVSYSQTTIPDTVKIEVKHKKPVLTNKVIVIKGTKYKVYQGAKGGLFIYRRSKKTGRTYKYYVTKRFK